MTNRAVLALGSIGSGGFVVGPSTNANFCRVH